MRPPPTEAEPTRARLAAYARAAPKVELHVHLEGAIQPETLLALARRHGVALPADDLAGLRRWFAFRDFPHFVEVYGTISGCLRTADDYALIVRELASTLAAQNVRYAEVTFTPSTHHALGVPHDAWFSGLARGRAQAKAESGVDLAWIFDISRQRHDRAMIRPLAEFTTAVATEGRDDGVVALGLGGGEAGAPPEPFAPFFDRARAAGLHSAPHAGEHAGPESVWGALRALGAERVGHGVRAIEDPRLVAYLAEQGIPLEISPTSNVCLGVVPHLAVHPLPALRAAGVPVTINSDDPPLFNTTLADEAALLADPFGLDAAGIDDVLLNAIRYSFLPAERRAALETAFAAELADLKRALLDPD